MGRPSVNSITREVESTINEVILRKGVRKTWIAEEMGVTLPMLSRWIHGHNTPSVEKALIIADLLDCEIGELFRLKSDK